LNGSIELTAARDIQLKGLDAPVRQAEL